MEAAGPKNMTTSRQMSVWLLTNIPSPYQVEFFSAISDGGQIRLDVRFMSLSFRGRPWDGTHGRPFQYVDLNGLGLKHWGDESRLHPRALREAISSRHDFYILSGSYASPTFIACAFLFASAYLIRNSLKYPEIL